MCESEHARREEWHGRNQMQLGFLDQGVCRQLMEQISPSEAAHTPSVHFEKKGWTVVLEGACVHAGIWCVYSLGEEYSELLRLFQRAGEGTMRKVLLYRHYSGITPIKSVVALFAHENVHVIHWSELTAATTEHGQEQPEPEWTAEQLRELCYC